MNKSGSQAQVIPEITPKYYAELSNDNVIKAGMIPKMNNAFRALKGGVDSITICNGTALNELRHNGIQSGTKVTLG